MAALKPICSVDSCDTISIAKGLCTKHYKRVAQYGDPHYAQKHYLPIPELKCCKACNEIMPMKKSAYEYTHRKFCSVKCMGASLRKPAQYLDCRQCGKNVERNKKPTGGFIEKQKYCSRECAIKSLNKGGHLDKWGYKIIHVNKIAIPEHRFVMEKVIGRKLLPEETVHHKNGIRTDNRPDNLELWSSRHCKGQRIEDKVAHAREILALYAKQSNVLTMSEAINGFMSLAA